MTFDFHVKSFTILLNFLVEGLIPSAMDAFAQNSTFLLNNSLSCSTNLEDKDKCYKELYETNPTKIILVILSVVFNVINIALPYGIIWYEHYGTDNKRTLVNKLVSLICRILIQWFIFCQPSDIIRYTFGPLPTIACAFQQIVKSSLKFQILLCFDALQITKFILIFVLKNPSAVQDDFWSIILSIWIVGVSTIQSFITFFVHGRKPLNYYTCADVDMIPVLNEARRTYGEIEIASFLILIIIQAKIVHYKSNVKVVPKDGNARTESKLTSYSLPTFTTNFISILLLCMFSLLTVKANKMSLSDLKVYPNYLFMQTFQLLGANFLGFLLSVVYYVKHPKMTKALYQNLKDSIKQAPYNLQI